MFLGQLPHILPDYMLVFAVPILAHDPEFTSHLIISQLKVIQQCLWFILEPLITKNEYYCYGFYKNLIERMKSHKDALKPEDNNMNYVIIRLNSSFYFYSLLPFHPPPLFILHIYFINLFHFVQKLWAVCDLAMNVIYTKTTNFDMKEFPSETRIPTMYFKRTDELANTKNYLPAEMQISMTNTKGKGSLHNVHAVNERPQRRAKSKQQKEVGIGPNETDARVRIK